MAPVEEKIKPGGLVSSAQSNLLEGMKLLKEMQDHSGELISYFLCFNFVE